MDVFVDLHQDILQWRHGHILGLPLVGHLRGIDALSVSVFDLLHHVFRAVKVLEARVQIVHKASLWVAIGSHDVPPDVSVLINALELTLLGGYSLQEVVLYSH